MKRLIKGLIILTLVSFVKTINAQLNQWTWVKGDSTGTIKGEYGTQNVSISSNKPGGRTETNACLDNDGNLWLFGGYGIPSTIVLGNLNDLWVYKPSINQWTWKKGDSTKDVIGVYGTQNSPNSLTKPGARGSSVTWTDNNNNLWLFAGNSYNKGSFNDLWKYSLVTNQWTWIKGNSTNNQKGVYGTQGIASTINKPGARERFVSWKEANGTLWLFGGIGYDANGNFGKLNDLWKYNITTNEWIWMKGDIIADQSGLYLVQGSSSMNAKPSGRHSCLAWVDALGNFWLFGGDGRLGALNDLWKYTPTANQWTWIKGDSTFNKKGVYGMQGTASSNANPGGRYYSHSFTDATNNNLWLYGGYGYANNTQITSLNDLWKYTPSTNQWEWVQGDSTQTARPPYYGIQGTASPANNPGKRYGGTMWSDSSGSFWLFGGHGSSGAYLNDLWKFSPATSLPVHLISFKAILKNDRINLYWKVENEQAFDQYVLERSSNGREFSKIGVTKARNYREYDFDDTAPLLHNFYRLKLVDKDGSYTYSKIVSVQLLTDKKLSIFPNPTDNILKLQFSKFIIGNLEIEVRDITGKVMQSERVVINGTVAAFGTTKLPTGTYTIRVKWNNGENAQQFIINR